MRKHEKMEFFESNSFPWTWNPATGSCKDNKTHFFFVTEVAGNWLKALLFGTFEGFKEGKKTTDYNNYLEEFLFFFISKSRVSTFQQSRLKD